MDKTTTMLLEKLETLEKNNQELLKAVKLTNKRIDVLTEKYNLLFEYCKKLKEGIEISMGS